MMDIQKLYDYFLSSHSVVSTDSRKAEGLFFALKGDNFDGNDFAAKALDGGAMYAVVDKPSVVKDDRFLLVDDTLKALQQLALFHRRKLSVKILAITGTNGKTTTKELVRDVLSKGMKVTATEGNFNNHIGVPLTLFSIKNDTKLAVVEMGANHPGEISTLCSLAEPDYGLITNVGVAHLEGFGSEEGIRKTKGELYDYLNKSGGTAFYNSSDSVLFSMISQRPGLNSISYKSDYDVSQDENGFISFTVDEKTYKSHFVGTVNIKNISAALAVGNYFGIPLTESIGAVTSYRPSNNRSQIVNSSMGNRIILDAYNANPSSMTEALKNFSMFPASDKKIILGQMNELGPLSSEYHKSIVLTALDIVDKDSLFLVGQNFSEILPERTFSDSEELISYFKNRPIKGNTILVKGSRTNRLEKMIDVL